MEDVAGVRAMEDNNNFEVTCQCGGQGDELQVEYERESTGYAYVDSWGLDEKGDPVPEGDDYTGEWEHTRANRNGMVFCVRCNNSTYPKHLKVVYADESKPKPGSGQIAMELL